jgi:hypothetical protein
MSWCIFIGNLQQCNGEVILGISDYRCATFIYHTDWPPYMHSAGNIKVMIF